MTQARETTMPRTRESLEANVGKVWDEKELFDEFVVTAWIGLTAVVQRKADNVVGLLDFQNEPRFYFNWQEHQETP
jgi:hypothetical protein